MTNRKEASPAAGDGGRTAGLVRKALVASLVLLFVASLTDTADAARKQRRTVASKSKKDVPIKHPFGENMPKGPLQLVVSIADQRITLYSNGVRVAQAPVSTGVPRHPTPTGIFSVIQKNRWHRSNLYGNAPMWYMHRLTWSGIALHEGVLPGRPASHGCIRLPQHFVSRLWNISKLGARVVVARTDLAPKDFSHPKLFGPGPRPKPAGAGETVSRPADELRPTLDTANAALAPAQDALIKVAEAAPVETTTITDATQPRAGVSAAEAAVASESVPSAPPATAEAPAESAPAAESSASAAPASELRRTDGGAASDITETGSVQTPVAAPEPAPASQSSPTAAPSPLQQVEVGPAKPAIDPAELRLPRPAPLRSRFAEPTKLSGQVAVFVSRKEKRVFVRHAFVPLFDMPVEIANPEEPLGTHLYTAVEATDNGTRMRWNVITMPPPSRQTAAIAKGNNKNTRNRRNAKATPKPAPKAAEAKPTSNAAQALDRVTIPQEAIERIAELLVPGSSLIISDEGLGRETGRYTEFIVETR